MHCMGIGAQLLIVDVVCDLQKPMETKKSNINYHLSRFYPQIIGPHKRK